MHTGCKRGIRGLLARSALSCWEREPACSAAGRVGAYFRRGIEYAGGPVDAAAINTGNNY